MREGIVVSVFRYSVWNFYGVTSTNGPETVIVSDPIAVPPYCRIGLSLRQHRLNVATGASITFSLRSINPSERDGVDFTASTVLGSTPALVGTLGAALVEFTSGNGFALGLVTNGPHPAARLVMTAAGAAAAALIYGVFSADLVLRSGS